MTNLKRIETDGIKHALDKADHYRLLNEPRHAESICLDVLEVAPENQHALVTLLLALTDQFHSRRHDAYQLAESLVPQLVREYDRLYYQGIITERWAIAQAEQGTGTWSVSEWLGRAMQCYEQAEHLTDGGNPDPVLRWNACARMKDNLVTSEPATAGLTRDIQSEFGDDVPPGH